MKVRKMVAGLAAVSMLAAFSAQAVLAADAVTLSAEKVSAKAGANFELKIDMDGVPATGINALEFAVTYDPAVVSITGVAAGTIINNGVDSAEGLDGAPAFGGEIKEDGMVTFTYTMALTDAKYFITSGGTFATLTGKVADGAKVGDSTDVKIVAIDRPVTEGSSNKNTDIKAAMVDDAGKAQMYTVSVSNGSVTVIGDGEQPTEPPVIGDKKYGDANCDNEVDLVDVILVNKHLMIGEKITDQGKLNADVDDNGTMDEVDSLNILKSIIRLVELPVK